MLKKDNPELTKLRLIIAKPFFRIHPNMLTLVGLIFSSIFFYFLVNHHYILAAIAYICTSFDAVDGIVARAVNKSTPFGEFLDAVIDRISDTFIISAFGFAQVVSWEIVISFLIGSYFVSYISARAGETGKGKIKLTGGIMELQDRRIALFFALIVLTLFPTQKVYNFNLIEIVFIILTVLTYVTVIQRFIKAYQLLR